MQLWNYRGYRIERATEDGECAVFPMRRVKDGWQVDRSKPARHADLDTAMRSIQRRENQKG